MSQIRPCEEGIIYYSSESRQASDNLQMSMHHPPVEAHPRNDFEYFVLMPGILGGLVVGQRAAISHWGVLIPMAELDLTDHA